MILLYFKGCPPAIRRRIFARDMVDPGGVDWAAKAKRQLRLSSFYALVCEDPFVVHDVADRIFADIRQGVEGFL
jgi:hypothetical protein